MTYISSSYVQGSVVSVPTGIAGDILVAITFDFTAAPAGYTQRSTITLTQFGYPYICRVYTKLRTGSEGSTHTFTPGTDFPILHLINLRDVSEIPVISSNKDEGSSTTITGTAVTATAAGTLLFWNNSFGGGASGTPSGMTVARTGDGSSSWYQELGAAGDTGSRTQTQTSAAWVSIMAAFASNAIAGPTIDTQPTNQYINYNDTATFTISATASAGSLTYQWQLNGVNVSTGSGGTTSSYTTAALTSTTSGYTCIVTDDNGNVTSNSVTAFVSADFLIIPTYSSYGIV